MSEHRGRLEVLYTDDGTMFKDRPTNHRIHVRKVYGIPTWLVTAQALWKSAITERSGWKAVGSERFSHNPRRRELTEWLDDLLNRNGGKS